MSIFASELKKKKTFEVIRVNHYVNRKIVEDHKKTAKSLIDGAIAQLVEQRTENPCVPGSIPGGTTKKRSSNELLFFCFSITLNRRTSQLFYSSVGTGCLR